MFILDVDDIRAIINDIGSKISNPDEQFKKINHLLERNFCIRLPRGLKYASTEKFGDVVSSPLVYERAINITIHVWRNIAQFWMTGKFLWTRDGRRCHIFS